MAQENPTFNVSQFELRNYTSPYFTPAQADAVSQTEGRVNDQLDFVAQMLGWSGIEYWTALADTVSQKRQLLGGTFGVYDSLIIPTVYEVRNWDETIVVDRLPFIKPGQQVYVENVEVGFDIYTIKSVIEEGDKFIVSLGPLPDSFYTQIANNVPIRVDIPSKRPAPFYRPTVGVAGDNSFSCRANGTTLTLYPAYDTQGLFPYKFPILFTGSVYYFNQPVYFSYTDSFTDNIFPTYDADLEVWYLQLPDRDQPNESSWTGYLVWPFSDSTTQTNVFTQISILQWSDPSDWNSLNVLNNFTGAWGNKGGALPFNLAFDSLSIHGFNEETSVYLGPVVRSLNFNDLVNEVYYQKTLISSTAPSGQFEGQLWWNSGTGALAVWTSASNTCANWVEIDYRFQPTNPIAPALVFPDVTSWLAAAPTIDSGIAVQILDAAGLAPPTNPLIPGPCVLGVTGTLTGPVGLTLVREGTTDYWTATHFEYTSVPLFSADALFLPFGVSVFILNSAGLLTSTANYTVKDLEFNLTGDYAVTLTKTYTNTTWVLSPDSILNYIGDTSLFGSPQAGEMWWDFTNTDPNTRAASIYFETAWVELNQHPVSAAPATPLDMGVVAVYSDNVLLTDGVTYVTDNYRLTYVTDNLTGEVTFTYEPRTFLGTVQFPTITVSDTLTSAYSSDISNHVFSGVTFYMSPNVQDAESPLRLWKGQDLQVAETLAHLAEDNYINPLRADLNNGPGPDNWERYYVRLPLDYGRNEDVWQKTALVCQDFGYWGSTIDVERLECPPESSVPAIYEELFLYPGSITDLSYVYCEPYLYSNIAYFALSPDGEYQNAGIFPAIDLEYDDFFEASTTSYDPLHDRQADVESPVRQGYGNWLGEYVNVNPCVPLTGFLTTDLLNGGVSPIAAPLWDASIYKLPPTCQNDPASYNVDMNHYKIGYAYFVADASAAEDGFFDVQQEAAWRYPVTQPRTLYVTPR